MMTASDRLALELTLLAPHRTPLTFEVAVEEYPFFYGLEEAPDTLRAALQELVSAKIVVDNHGALSFTTDGRQWCNRTMVAFDFSDGAALFARSATDHLFCRRLREDHGIIGITDESQQEYLVDVVSQLPAPVLDIGCGSGSLTRLLNHQTGKQFIGIDISADFVGMATKEYPDMQFLVHDFNNLQTLSSRFNSALLVDSLYFANDPMRVLTSVDDRIADDGGIVALYSVYARSESDSVTLSPRHTPLWGFVEHRGRKCITTEFSGSESRIWSLKREIITSMRSEYYNSHEAYIYYNRLNEINILAERNAEGRARRFGFLIRPS